MEEIVFWKEVPESNKVIFDDNDDPIYLKRVVMPILSDQEIIDLSNEVVPSFFDKNMWRKGYKAKQNERIGGEEL